MTTETNGQTSTSDVGAEWLDDHLPTVFSRGHEMVLAAQRTTVAMVIAESEVTGGQTVLDVGGGSGIPTLALAERVGPSGRVVAAEPSPIFAEAMAVNARSAGLTNIEIVRVGAAQLPFPPGSFDAATCHMGVMFFPDVRAGLIRMRETLRPGARAAFVAWGPNDDNRMIRTFQAAIGPFLPASPQPATSLERAMTDRAAPEPDTPKPDRFAQPGSLSAALRAAGFGDVHESNPVIEWTWPTPAEGLVDFMLDMARLGNAVDRERYPAMREAAISAYRPYESGGDLRIPARMVIASGRA